MLNELSFIDEKKKKISRKINHWSDIEEIKN